MMSRTVHAALVSSRFSKDTVPEGNMKSSHVYIRFSSSTATFCLTLFLLLCGNLVFTSEQHFFVFDLSFNGHRSFK